MLLCNILFDITIPPICFMAKKIGGLHWHAPGCPKVTRPTWPVPRANPPCRPGTPEATCLPRSRAHLPPPCRCWLRPGPTPYDAHLHQRESPPPNSTSTDCSGHHLTVQAFSLTLHKPYLRSLTLAVTLQCMSPHWAGVPATAS